VVCRNGNPTIPSSQSSEIACLGQKKLWTRDYCSKITLSGVEAPDVTPIVIGPCGSQFSFSTNSPC